MCRQGHRTEQAVETPGEQRQKGHREADTEDTGATPLEKSTHKICDLMKGQIKHICHARRIMSGNFIRQQTRGDLQRAGFFTANKAGRLQVKLRRLQRMFWTVGRKMNGLSPETVSAYIQNKVCRRSLFSTFPTKDMNLHFLL